MSSSSLTICKNSYSGTHSPKSGVRLGSEWDVVGVKRMDNQKNMNYVFYYLILHTMSKLQSNVHFNELDDVILYVGNK